MLLMLKVATFTKSLSVPVLSGCPKEINGLISVTLCILILTSPHKRFLSHVQF